MHTVWSQSDSMVSDKKLGVGEIDFIGLDLAKNVQLQV